MPIKPYFKPITRKKNSKLAKKKNAKTNLKLKQVKSISSSRATTTRPPIHGSPGARAGTPSSRPRRASPRGQERACTPGQERAE